LLSPLKVIARHLLGFQQTLMSPAVGRGRVHTASFVTPFRLWNDIGICKYIKVICTSDFRPPSWILDTGWYTNVIVLQSTVNEERLKWCTMHRWLLKRS